jgi:hypothetical protein
VIVCNPAYVAAEVEDDQDDVEEIDSVDLAPLVSGSVTAPASEDEDETEDEDIPVLETDHSTSDDDVVDGHKQSSASCRSQCWRFGPRELLGEGVSVIP